MGRGGGRKSYPSRREEKRGEEFSSEHEGGEGKGEMFLSFKLL